jgi:6-phosphogluconate dehydrogenase
MKIGFIGLGKMGISMVERILKNHSIVAFARTKKSISKAKKKGAIGATSIKNFISKLAKKKIIWLMVPAGNITTKIIDELTPFLKKGDILIDGGNSFYKDSMKRAKNLSKKGVLFLDVGTSGGVWGLKKGYSLMVGGDKKAFNALKPIFKSLTEGESYIYTGKSGSGHFVKMVHNGIEYGLMQAYAEGFELLKAKKEFNLNLHLISNLWNKNSVIRSWLLELLEDILKKDQTLKNVKGYVEDSGEGRWTVKESIDLNVPLPVISLSLMERFSSRQKNKFSKKILSSLRNAFGGHELK